MDTEKNKTLYVLSTSGRNLYLQNFTVIYRTLKQNCRQAVLRIRMFYGLLDPDLLVKGAKK